MIELHDYVQFFLVVILFFVLWFYVNIILDFGEFNTKHDPKFLMEKTYTHVKARNIAHIGWLEVVWTIIPIIILTAIAIPSFKLLYALDVVNSPLVTLRCIGNQWYWTYECDIIKPRALTNLQTYLTKGSIVKNELIPFTLKKKQMPILTSTALNFIQNPEIAQISVNLNEEYTDGFINDAANMQAYNMHEIRYGQLCKVLEDSSQMPFNYFSQISADFYKFIYPVAFQIEELRNSLLHVEAGYDLDAKVLPAIITVAKYTDKFQQESESFAVDSYILDTDDLQLGAFRLLEVDNFPKLPANAEIRLAITGTDVIHSFAVPSLGVKIDAIPGRLNQFGVRIRVPGTYYGQCSELCGVGHGFMPIKVQFIKLIK